MEIRAKVLAGTVAYGTVAEPPEENDGVGDEQADDGTLILNGRTYRLVAA